MVHREYLKKENDLLHDIVNTKNLQIGILNDKLILFDDKIKSDDIVIGNQLIIIGNKDKEIQIYTDKLNKEKAKKVNNFVYGGVAGILLTLILTR